MRDNINKTLKAGDTVDVYFERAEAIHGAVIVYTPECAGDYFCLVANNKRYNVMNFSYMCDSKEKVK